MQRARVRLQYITMNHLCETIAGALSALQRLDKILSTIGFRTRSPGAVHCSQTVFLVLYREIHNEALDPRPRIFSLQLLSLLLRT